jgi:RNA polymerase sigma-70 factor (ECF subfamily)
MHADIATLLAEAPWLARLARSLTGDAAEADDLVQETYAAALRSPPATDRPVRPWLRRVVINLARMRHRSRSRRAATDRVVETQTDPVRDPEQLLERARLERRLAELVLELDEPFRTTVLLRYREGLSAEQIATQQGIPAGTVRGRLKTALDRLRRELGEREQKQLQALFVPLVPGGPTTALRRLVMAKLTSKTAIASVVVLLLIGGALFVWHRLSPSPRVSREAEVASTPKETARALIARPAMFVQSGVAGRHVRGRVTTEGKPYGGAVVQIAHAETDVVVGEVRSAADGTFDLSERPADTYVVAATAPGRVAAPVVVDLRLPTTAALELRLDGCSHVRGNVVDGSGAPIAHARVARDDTPGVFVESDANGHYDLCTHFGSVLLRYSASGFHGLLVGLDVAINTTRDVVLVPEAIVEGTVVDEDGAPVAGAWVVIDPNELGGPERKASVTGFSARDGTFRIAGAAPGRNLVAGFAPRLRSAHKQELITGAGRVTSGVIIRLTRSATIAGVVVSGGVPVPGVGVGIRIGNRDESGVLAVTQADGSFVIDRAPRGDVALFVPHHTVIAPRSVHVGDDSPRVTIEVQRMGSVRGRVVREGQPVAAAQVTCPGPRPKTFTDANGNYVCDGVDDGAQELFADLATGEWGRATATVARGTTVQLDIPLTFAGAICGRVVDERGAPVAGIEVRVAERETGDFGKDVSAGDGSFCARVLTGGVYGVAVYAATRALDPLAPIAPVTLGPRETKHLTIAVTAPMLSITGVVSDPRGVPVVDAVVRVAAAGALSGSIFDFRARSAITITDESGHFTFSKLAAGDYTIIATAGDGSEVIVSPIAAGARDVAIELSPAGRIEGELVGFASAPTITGMMTDGKHLHFDAEVNARRFHANGLSPGTYVLMAVTDGREADAKQIIVRPAETTRVTLTSRGTATVSGVVRDFRTRAPVTGFRCAGFARDGDATGVVYAGPDEAVPTDARGAFRIVSSAGEIQISCYGNGRAASRTLVAPRDRTTSIELFSVAVTQVPGTIDATFENMTRRIRDLVNGGAAQRAGLAIGDEVIAVDGASVVELDPREVMLLITQRPAGGVAQLAIVRGGERRTVAVNVRSSN